MLDVLNLPKPQNGYIDYFFGDAATAATSWRTWEKPRGISMIDITCIGAGGGAASGSAAGGSASPGSGGGSGGFTRVIIPAMVLPDVLYVSVGKGGAGGAAGVMVASVGSFNSGAAGTASYVSIAPSTAAIYTACFANGGGGAGASQIGGTAGIAGAIATRSNALMSGLGEFFALVGQAGQVQNSGAGITLSYPTTGLLLSGGGAGGSPSFAGGNITAPTQTSFSLIPTRTGGTTGSPLGGPGADGISLLQPLMSIGGAGGGACANSTLNGISGRGGNGGLGSGGGGGGAFGGTSAGTSGRGGNGGDGLVIIQTF